MPDLKQIEKRRRRVGDLQDIIESMKAMAAVAIRRCEEATESIREHAALVESAVARLLAGRLPPKPVTPKGEHRAGLVLFTSDQGLCGSYNEKIILFAEKHLKENPGTAVLAIGSRGAHAMEAAGQDVRLAVPAPGALAGIDGAIRKLFLKVRELNSEGDLDFLHCAYNRYRGVGRFEERLVRVMPPDLERLADAPPLFERMPLLHARPDDILPRLLQEYLFIQLYRAFAEAMTSENGSRLSSMNSASRNIENKLEELTQLYRQVRQEEITAELLDVVGGAAALT